MEWGPAVTEAAGTGQMFFEHLSSPGEFESRMGRVKKQAGVLGNPCWLPSDSVSHPSDNSMFNFKN